MSYFEARTRVSKLPPMAIYLKNSRPLMRGSLALRGFLSMMSMSGALKLRAVAGRPSVTRLTHRSCTGIRASGIPKAAVKKMLRGRTENIGLFMEAWMLLLTL